MKKNTLPRRIFSWITQHWRGLLAGTIIATIAAITLSLQITTLIDGQNKYETATLHHLETFPNPTERMINAPYLIPAYIIGSNINEMLIGARITSVVFCLIATVALFILLKRWFSIQIASVGSLLFITSSWVLAISHQATPLILLVLTPLVLIISLTRFANEKKHSYGAFLQLICAVALALYVPYMFWPVAVVSGTVALLYRHKLATLNRKQIVVAAIVFAALLVPLFISITQYPGQIKEVLGIPIAMPSLGEYSNNFMWQFSTLFFVSQPFPELYLGRLPLLDIFSVAMTLLGIYHFAKYMPKRRKFSFAVLIAVLLIIVPLSIPYQPPMTAYIAIIYIFIAAGVYELLQQWFNFFPRNPFARNTAVVLVSVLIGMAALYNLQKFYIAWPNAPETKAVYVVQSNKD